MNSYRTHDRTQEEPARYSAPNSQLRPGVVVDIAISAESMQKNYAGTANTVSANSRDGRRIRFPASILRSFVTRDGVHGSFELIVDQELRLQDIRRLA